MELFYSRDIASGGLTLDSQESAHCIRVLRHREGDQISIVDGAGCLYRSRILKADPAGLQFEVLEVVEGYGSHPYHLHMAVAPPKNPERFEWFAAKATEIGVDEITPLFGDYSERRVFKGDRIERLIVSSAKQSHKAALPLLHPAMSVRDFLASVREGGRFICYCGDTADLGAVKIPLTGALCDAQRDITVMIGPEGDFSHEEIALAVSLGWQIVSLGESRLRIETAALVATSAVYLKFV